MRIQKSDIVVAVITSIIAVISILVVYRVGVIVGDTQATKKCIELNNKKKF